MARIILILLLYKLFLLQNPKEYFVTSFLRLADEIKKEIRWQNPFACRGTRKASGGMWEKRHRSRRAIQVVVSLERSSE